MPYVASQTNRTRFPGGASPGQKGSTTRDRDYVTKYSGGPMNGSYESEKGTLVANPDWRPAKGQKVIKKTYDKKTKKYR
jgi:hypothetical protein